MPLAAARGIRNRVCSSASSEAAGSDPGRASAREQEGQRGEQGTLRLDAGRGDGRGGAGAVAPNATRVTPGFGVKVGASAGGTVSTLTGYSAAPVLLARSVAPDGGPPEHVVAQATTVPSEFSAIGWKPLTSARRPCAYVIRMIS